MFLLACRIYACPLTVRRIAEMVWGRSVAVPPPSSKMSCAIISAEAHEHACYCQRCRAKRRSTSRLGVKRARTVTVAAKRCAIRPPMTCLREIRNLCEAAMAHFVMGRKNSTRLYVMTCARCHVVALVCILRLSDGCISNASSGTCPSARPLLDATLSLLTRDGYYG